MSVETISRPEEALKIKMQYNKTRPYKHGGEEVVIDVLEWISLMSGGYSEYVSWRD